MLNSDTHTDWCLSGGADGADLWWGLAASGLDHGVIHFSFRGARTAASPEQLHILTEADLAAADPQCHQANRTLRRRFPAHSPYVTDLLRRDWYQVAIANSCYAVSTLGLPPGPTLPLNTVVTGEVKGGTAWAVQMFIDRHEGAACACYLFDQVACHWFQWLDDGWTSIYEPPQPTGVYAGIGARELLPIGRTAIRVLMHDIIPVRLQCPQTTEAARLRYEARAVRMEGHKMGAWESLSELMREELIRQESLRSTK